MTPYGSAMIEDVWLATGVDFVVLGNPNDLSTVIGIPTVYPYNRRYNYFRFLTAMLLYWYPPMRDHVGIHPAELSKLQSLQILSGIFLYLLSICNHFRYLYFRHKAPTKRL